MTKLACGCNFGPDWPFTREEIQEHFKHTMEALFVWELLHRRGVPQGDDHMKLSQARIDVIDAIEKLYPEVREN